MFKNNIELQKNLGFIFFTLALLLALLVRTYFMHGNSSDGFLYDTISRDMSVGVGGTWAPSWFAQNGLSVFYEHPSFSIFLNSLFYRVLGDSIFVGKLYIFTTFALSMFFVCLIWRRFFKSLSWHYLWIPVLFWLCIPEHLWCYKSTMIQNTEAVFSLCASWLIFVSLDIEFDYKQNKRLFYKACGITSLAAIALFFAFITNGPESLFPLAIYMAHWLIIRSESFSRACFRSLLLFGVFLLFGVIFFYFIPAAYHNFYMYFKVQLLASINGEREGAHLGLSRLYIVKKIFEKLVGLLVVTLIIFYFYQKSVSRSKQNRLIDSENSCLSSNYFFPNLFYFCKKDKRISLFMFIGLIASVPVMISQKQNPWYIMQSYAYFLLGFLFILTPSIVYLLDSKWMLNFNKFKFRLLSLSLLLISIFFVGFSAGGVYTDSGVYSDNQTVYDVIKMSKFIPKGSIIGSNNPSNLWSLDSFFKRYSYDRVKVIEPGFRPLYFVSIKGGEVPVSYQKIESGAGKYDLYKLT